MDTEQTAEQHDRKISRFQSSASGFAVPEAQKAEVLHKRSRRGLATPILAIGAVLLASCADAVRPDPAKPFAGIPNLRFSYYEVSGGTAEEIRRSINERRPSDSHDGQRVDARTEWTIGWALSVTESGDCNLSEAKVSYAATVILPKHVDPASLPDSLRAHWQAYVASLARHEDWHARYAYEHLGDVEGAIRASSCRTAESAAAAAVRAIAEVERNYDIDARRRGGEVIPFP